MYRFELFPFKKEDLSTIDELKTKDLDSESDRADEHLYNLFYDKFHKFIKKYGAKKMSKVSDKGCSLMIHLNLINLTFSV